MSAIWVFCDLDDTLLQTEAKCGNGGPLREAAYDRNGQALSYHTPQQWQLLQLLAPSRLIPVTGRTSEALNRVRSPVFSDWRITSHGAVLCDAQGQVSSEWLAHIAEERLQWEGFLQRTLQRALSYIADHHLIIRGRILEDGGLPVYLSFKGQESDLAHLAQQLSADWQALGGTVHRNGHNMALLPPYATKSRAVQFLLQLLSRDQTPPLVLGLGDSISDLPFMQLCDFAVIPRHSQIQRELWSSTGGG